MARIFCFAFSKLQKQDRQISGGRLLCLSIPAFRSTLCQFAHESSYKLRHVPMLHDSVGMTQNQSKWLINAVFSLRIS